MAAGSCGTRRRKARRRRSASTIWSWRAASISSRPCPTCRARTFTGPGGASHTFSYKEPERYRGLRVLVAGCAISALEIASDLAMLGAARVVTTNRRQRYVAVKLAGGVPTDHLAFTRFAALAAETFPRRPTPPRSST